MASRTIRATWAVEYDDGSMFTQYTEQLQERSMRDIEWSRVRRLMFESALATASYDVTPVTDVKMSLRRRVMNVWVMATNEWVAVEVLMFVLSALDEEPSDDNVVDVLYWLPNGVEHQCRKFNCGEINEAATRMGAGKPPLPLSHLTEIAPLGMDALLVD